MSKDLEIVVRRQENIIERLVERIKYCEGVAQQYESMYKQLQMEMRAIADRQGNIQQVYDYLTRVGSEIAIKTPHQKKFLNPLTKEIDISPQELLEIMKKFKFKVGDEVFYANESLTWIAKHIIKGIDIIDKHPRYCLEGIFGYVDESKIFSTVEQAREQLDEWNRSS